MKLPGLVWSIVLIAILIVGGIAAYFYLRPGNEMGIRSVILITLDTVRADRLGCYGGDSEITPNLDRLAREGVLFNRCLTTAPITLPAHASILSGVDPIAHGVRVNGAFGFDPENPSLARVLQGRGYRTGAFVSGYVLDHRYGLGEGFDVYDDQRVGSSGGVDPEAVERPGRLTVEAALDFVDEIPFGPYFLWVHLFDAHAPYEAPEPFSLRFEDPYDAELAYVDACVGELLASLEARGRLDDALVAVVADHGEGLGDHGESTHTVFAYDTTLRVPFIIWSRGRLAQGAVMEPTVSVTSVAPTLLDLLDVERPAEMYGPSLASWVETGTVADGTLPTLARFESLASSYYYGFAPLAGVDVQGKKLIVLPRPELYATRQDPGELQNRYETDPDTAAQLKREMDAYDRSHRTTRSLPREMGPGEEARLRQLGYVVGSHTGDEGVMDPKDGIELVETLQTASMLSRDDLPGAVALLEEVLKENGGVAEVWELLGDLRSQAGNQKAAADAYRSARDRTPGNPELYLKEGTARAQLGDVKGAEVLMKAAADLDPSSVRAQVDLGLLLLRAGRTEAAKRRFDGVLLEHPDIVAARIGRAECVLQLQNIRLADQDLRAAVAEDPDNPHALWRLVRTCVLLRNLKDALLFRDRAIAIDPQLSWSTEIQEELDRAAPP